MNLIHPDDLVDIQDAAIASGVHLRTALAYADSDPASTLNHVFREPIYRQDARMWMHRDLADVVLKAADDCWKQKNIRFVLLDCLRTTDAQRRMADTKIVKANPHWTAPGPNQLLSNPGEGAHPRAMAVDIMLESANGMVLDMGTAFDHWTLDPKDNPADRKYPHAAEILNNRNMLNDFMTDAAAHFGREIYLLPSEWWDFRFKPEIYNQYAPLSDADLPPKMRMCR